MSYHPTGTAFKESAAFGFTESEAKDRNANGVKVLLVQVLTSRRKVQGFTNYTYYVDNPTSNYSNRYNAFFRYYSTYQRDAETEEYAGNAGDSVSVTDTFTDALGNSTVTGDTPTGVALVGSDPDKYYAFTGGDTGYLLTASHLLDHVESFSESFSGELGDSHVRGLAEDCIDDVEADDWADLTWPTWGSYASRQYVLDEYLGPYSYNYSGAGEKTPAEWVAVQADDGTAFTGDQSSRIGFFGVVGSGAGVVTGNTVFANRVRCRFIGPYCIIRMKVVNSLPADFWSKGIVVSVIADSVNEDFGTPVEVDMPSKSTITDAMLTEGASNDYASDVVLGLWDVLFPFRSASEVVGIMNASSGSLEFP